MAIKTIAHLADIHIRKSTLRHDEYREVFNNLVQSLRTEKPDRIVIVGDLFHDYNKIEGELLILASKFVNALAKIAPLIITRGNHDILRSALNRVDSIDALISAIDNPNVKFYNETGFFVDENVVWCVWKHGEKKNSPWDGGVIKEPSKTYIDLYHDPVNGCVNADGFEFNSKTYRSLKSFEGDYSFFGDIHKHQYLNDAETKAYSGSLIAQNFSEGDDEFHGYILWDIANGTHKDVPISNNYKFSTVVVNRFTDFDNLNIHISNPATHNFLRVKWQTLPAIKNTENEDKLNKHLQERYSPVYIKHKAEFVEEDKIDIQEAGTIDNITKREVLHPIFTEYLQKIGLEEDVIADVIKLDQEIENRIQIEDLTNIQWSIVKFSGKHFRNIREINIDWRDKNGIFQITGENTAGKSSIIQLLSYILYGKTLETDKTKKFGDSRFVNNRISTNSCEGYLVINCNGEYYGIKRTTTLEFNKKGEMKGSPTVVSYYKLSDPDETLSADNDITSLNEEERKSTQRRIDEIIGTYANFTRIILTTADTLNSILGTESADFIDSILNDSGLDIFDLRLTEFKKYRKELISNDRISCNLDTEESAITYLQNQNAEYGKRISNHILEGKEILAKIESLEDEKERLSQTMHQIDPSIAALNVGAITAEISQHKRSIAALDDEKAGIEATIAKLKETYDADTLTKLIEKRESHRSDEFKLRTEINNLKLQSEQILSKQHRANGDIELLKREGASKKQEILALKDSKNCPTCGQLKTEDSLNHIQTSIKEKETYMFGIVDKIKKKQREKEEFAGQIDGIKYSIAVIEQQIAEHSIGFEAILVQIGDLNNEKLEVERRIRLTEELKGFPIRYENLDLKIQSLEDKIVRFNELKSKIEENDKIKLEIGKLNDKLNDLKRDHQETQNLIGKFNNDILFNDRQITQKTELIRKYKEQVKQDTVMSIYEKCVHRDGIPTQILTKILLPKINASLANLLDSVDFDVWLDESDLKLKMSYSRQPNAVIDCMGGSGKERTFSSISLKVALNEINTKSKPTIFMLDEVMGKLKGESVLEFLEFLGVIKTRVNKMIVIEQNHEINPDYIIHAAIDNNGVSTINLLDDEA